jgi:ABC-type phosphate transport system substrate-binding protein
MKNIAIILVIVLAIGLLIGFSPVKAQDSAYKVIINSSNGIDSASKSDISKWFLKKKTKWDDGQKIVPVDLSADSSVRESFTREIHGKSVSGIKNYWQKQIFSGKGTPPVEKGSDAEVLDFVKSNPGAIGYVSSDADVSGVKVITVN